MASASIIDDILASITTHCSNPLVTTDSTQRPTTRNKTTSTNPLSHLPPSASGPIKTLLTTLHFFFPHELLPALDIIDRRLIMCLRYPVASTRPSTRPHTAPHLQHHPQPQPRPPDEAPLQPSSPATVKGEVWYVQSASAAEGSSTGGRSRGGRYRNAYKATESRYEVRLDSWNCECAAFAFESLKVLRMNGDGDGGLGVKQRPRHREGEEGKGLSGAGDKMNGLSEGEIGRGRELVDEKEKKRRMQRDWAFGGMCTNGNMGVPVCKHILAALLCKAAPEVFGHGMVVREVSKEELAGWGGGWGDHG